MWRQLRFNLDLLDDRLVILVAYKQIVCQSAQSKHQQGKPYDGRYVIPSDRYFANGFRSEELFGMQRVYRNGIYFYGQCFGPVRLSVYHHLEWGEIVKCRVKRGYCIFLFYQHTLSIVQHLGIRLGYIQYLHSFYQRIAQERKLQFLLGIHADFQLHFSLFANEKLQRVNAGVYRNLLCLCLSGCYQHNCTNSSFQELFASIQYIHIL